MRTMTAREAEQDIEKLLANARREPVTVTAIGIGSAVVMSADAYARMRGEAVAALRATLDRTRAYAASQGLIDAELDRLLADES
jgi:prevent-host-death family protein